MTRLFPPAIITGMIVAMTGVCLFSSPSVTQSQPPKVAPAAGPSTGTALVSAQSQALSPAGMAASPVNPHLTLGSETCVKCHANEVKVWQSTPHSRTFDELHRRPEAKQIAAKLGLQSIKHDGRCVNCHYTQQTDLASGNVHAIEGVSCESCHGSAKNWLDTHHNYGGENVTRAMESPQHRSARLARSVELGMRNPVNVYLVAQSCLRCHTTADEELVNVGGHPTGSLDFEFVSWSQGAIRHNFVRSDGRENSVSSPERLRVMFVSGMIAELEASLRATATATQKATYGVTSAQRAARAAKRLQSVSQKISSPLINDVLSVFTGIQLKLNNRAQLTEAADAIASLGFRFANETDPATLAPLDAFVPPSTRWK